MFAALLVLAVLAISLYFAVDRGLKWALPWVVGEGFTHVLWRLRE